MSGKWPGGIISKTAPTVVGPTDGEGGSASGIWTLDQAADYEKQGLWPKPVIPRELWNCGSNDQGQLAQGNTTVRSSPVQIGALTDWPTVSSRDRSVSAIKSDGTLWSWGMNNVGQLGVGDTTNTSSPVQVGALTDWDKLACGFQTTATIKTDGTMWLFGSGKYGALGDGTTVDKSSPVQMGALTTWSKIGYGYGAGIAIKTDGTLWTWGTNWYGQMGIGTSGNTYNSPNQVGALTDWSFPTAGGGDVGFDLCVKTDGTLWAWGRNDKGQLGTNNTTDYSSPVQVGALTDWAEVQAGEDDWTAALKTDGTIWAWGEGSAGQLGQGNTTDYSSPVQVGALTTWSKISTAYNIFYALKTDGTVWAWGAGNDGALGQGNTTSYSSPVQVGALTTWMTLAKNSPSSSGFIGIKQP